MKDAYLSIDPDAVNDVEEGGGQVFASVMARNSHEANQISAECEDVLWARRRGD